MNRLATIAGLCASLSGCITVPSINAELEHISQPDIGPPFDNQRELWMDTLHLLASWQTGSLYTTLGFGYKLTNGLDPKSDWTGTVRIGVKLYEPKQ